MKGYGGRRRHPHRQHIGLLPKAVIVKVLTQAWAPFWQFGGEQRQERGQIGTSSICDAYI